MTNAEQAIRNALLKLDASNKAIRRRVYESAWTAHERALVNDRSLNNQDYVARREQLARIIALIEDEYRALDDTIETAENEFLAYGPEDEIPFEDNENVFFQNSTHPAQSSFIHKKKGTYITAIIIIFCIVFVAFILWSFYNSMTTKPIEVSENSDKKITQIIENQTIQTPKADDGWVLFFNPANIETLSTRGAAAVQVRNDMGEPYVYIFANSAQDAAIIDIGEGVLMKLRGKKALIDIVAKSAGANKTQLSLTCNLGTANDCGRRRFEVPATKDNLVLEVNVPENGKGGGELYLTSDLLGEGNAINIYSISIKTAE